MPKYFKPKPQTDGRPYRVTRKTRRDTFVRDQLPHEGVYTPYEMSCIQEDIPGEWLTLRPNQVGYVFGLRQILNT